MASHSDFGGNQTKSGILETSESGVSKGLNDLSDTIQRIDLPPNVLRLFITDNTPLTTNNVGMWSNGMIAALQAVDSQFNSGLLHHLFEVI